MLVADAGVSIAVGVPERIVRAARTAATSAIAALTVTAVENPCTNAI